MNGPPESASMLWRRLDAPGHDACRLERTGEGWRLAGTAVFRQAGKPACLAYVVQCDPAFWARRGEVVGWVGGRAVELRVARSARGPWTMDGASVPGLEACLDLDLGFTPATNMLALRRLALEPGQAAEAPAAHLGVTGELARLPQRYARLSETEYAYEAPSVPFSASLEVDAAGFVRRYPGLWEREP